MTALAHLARARINSLTEPDLQFVFADAEVTYLHEATDGSASGGQTQVPVDQPSLALLRGLIMS